jgi:hypothetical protein
MGDWTGTVPTILPGYIVTGDDWKSVLDLLTALTSAQASYAPTWSTTGTAPALGDGSLSGGYTRLGNLGLVFFRIAFAGGTTTTYGTGGWRFTLPDNPAQPTNMDYNWAGTIIDSGTYYPAPSVFVGPNLVAPNTGSPMTAVTVTSPMTWANTDRLFIHGWYWSA